MNIKSIIASASLLAVTATFAGAAMAEGLTREQVAADTVAAIQAGKLDNSEAAQDNTRVTAGVVTREQVKSETLAAIAAGKLEHNELYDSGTYLLPLIKTGNVKAQLAATAAKQNQQ
jgi:hypothetical protein